MRTEESYPVQIMSETPGKATVSNRALVEDEGSSSNLRDNGRSDLCRRPRARGPFIKGANCDCKASRRVCLSYPCRQAPESNGPEQGSRRESLRSAQETRGGLIWECEIVHMHCDSWRVGRFARRPLATLRRGVQAFDLGKEAGVTSGLWRRRCAACTICRNEG
jgi:hypothetical protein